MTNKLQLLLNSTRKRLLAEDKMGLANHITIVFQALEREENKDSYSKNTIIKTAEFRSRSNYFAEKAKITSDRFNKIKSELTKETVSQVEELIDEMLSFVIMRELTES